MINWFKRVGKKFSNATKGAIVILKEENSLWVHLFITGLVVIFGLILDISLYDWALISLSIGLVIGFEIINTAIEYLVDIVSFEYNIKAKKVKDVAALATLFVTIIAIIIGLIVFIPEISNSIGNIS